ncbi:hypothetical protein K4F52_010022 [Lecanicillium sp. MT-2017a]|nr:hypothetical protein K4F52_010022 [Lecanicillium sp. MT-2017a]
MEECSNRMTKETCQLLGSRGSACKAFTKAGRKRIYNSLLLHISAVLMAYDKYKVGLPQQALDAEFEDSKVTFRNGTTVIDPSHRFSKTSYPTQTKLFQCIKDRSRDFQGFGTFIGRMEAIQVVKYESGGHYVPHFDWSPGSPRLSSIFAYVQANGTGGGTNFPELDRPEYGEWCDFVDCSVPLDDGVTFKPIPGNAIFWQSVQPSGDVHPKTMHAGVPVISGHKIGINVWAWKKDY